MSGFGQSGTGSSTGAAGASSAFGSSTGAITSGQSSLLQSQLNAGDGSLGATIGTGEFIGASDNAGRFIGIQNAGQTGRATNMSQQLSQLQNLINRNQENWDSSTQQTTISIRPQVRLGFEAPTEKSTQLLSDIQPRIASLPALNGRANAVRFDVSENGQVTLLGSVKSESDRRLIEVLTRMEPGVRTVVNELAVVP